MNSNQGLKNEQEIDLKKVIIFVGKGRKWFLLGGALGLIFGIIFYVLAPKEFSSTIKLLPTAGTSPSSSSSLLKQFGGLAGLSLDQSSVGITVEQYNSIITSTPFLLELLQESFTTVTENAKVRLDSLIFQEYVMSKPALIVDYTLKLPFTLIALLRNADSREFEVSDKIISLSKDQMLIMQEVKDRMVVEMNDQGLLQITVNMPDPVLSAELTQRVSELLIEKVRAFYIESQSNQLIFLQEKEDETYGQFVLAQQNLAEFRDANYNLVTESIKSKERKLESEYNLAFNIYSTVSSELESSKIKMNESMPVLSTIDPAVIPLKKSYPSVLLFIIGGVFLGVFLGFSAYFLKVLVYEFKAQRYEAD